MHDFARYCCGDPSCPLDCERDKPSFFVAKHWPLAYIVMRAEMDGADSTVLRSAVLRSVREALGVMGIDVVEGATDLRKLRLQTSDRCLAFINGDFMAPRCGMNLGHEGPHVALSEERAMRDSAHPLRRDGSGCASAEVLSEVSESRPSSENAKRLHLPRRRWVVEFKSTMFDGPWMRSLGPYFMERTARDLMRRASWFDHGTVEWRVRRV